MPGVLFRTKQDPGRFNDPHGFITEFTADEVGDLVITIGSGQWDGGMYDDDMIPGAMSVAGNVVFKIAQTATDVDTVTAVTEDGSQSYTEVWQPYLDTYYDGVELLYK